MALEQTKVGLPNTCAQCGARCEATWWAENWELASAGLGFCEACVVGEKRVPVEDIDAADDVAVDEVEEIADGDVAGDGERGVETLEELSATVRANLQQAGFETCADLAAAPDAELRGIEGVGPKTLTAIRAQLQA